VLAPFCAEAEPTGRGAEVIVTAPPEGLKGLSGPTKIYDNSHAVVIGINRYLHVRELTGAVRDGKAMAAALRERGFDVKELYDESATRERIIGELAERLPGRLGTADRVLVYFAGHGVSTGTGTNVIGYLLPVDGRSDKAISTGISMRELQAWLGGYKSKHVLFVADACYSGLALDTRGLARSSAQSDYLKLVTRDPVRMAFVAGGDGEEAIEANGEGLFTRFLLEALEGAADSDGDGVMTGDEIAAYVKPKVTTAAQTLLGRSQRPQVARSGMGEFIFLTLGKPLGSGPDHLAMRKLPTEVDRADPLDMAGAILAAYRARDFITLAELSLEHNKEIFVELAREGSAHGRYKSIFTGWRWKAVSAWDGRLREVRYRGSTAEVAFHDMVPDEVAVVVLEWNRARRIWEWEDVNSPERSSFEQLSLTPPAGLPATGKAVDDMRPLRNIR
jgi:hypothetical protein